MRLETDGCLFVVACYSVRHATIARHLSIQRYDSSRAPNAAASAAPKRGAKQGGQSRSMRIYGPNVGRTYRVLQLS